MPYTLHARGHGPIEFLSEIPSTLSGIIKPGAEAQYAEGAFGNILLQQITAGYYTVEWNHYNLKEKLTLDNPAHRAAVQIKIMQKGSELYHDTTGHDINIKEHQFYIAYLPASATSSSFEPGKETIVFTFSFPPEVLHDHEKIFSALTPFIQQAERQHACALFPTPGWITLDIENLVLSLLDCDLPPMQKNYYYDIITRQMIMLLMMQKQYLGKVAVSEKELEGIQKVRKTIEAGIGHIPSLKQLAGISGMSVLKLKMLFKEVVGHSISDFIFSTRLKKAKHLLLHTNLPVKQVASLSGYTSAGNFIRAFRNEFYCTPNLLRK